MSMSTTTSGATIFYTSDGTTPTHNGGTATGSTQVYNGSFTTPSCADTQYYAIAYKSGYTDSNMTGYLSKHGSDFGCFGGMMMSSSQSQTIVFSVWDGDWALLEEYDNTGALVQKYLQGYHGLVKTFVSTAVYYYQDELGSTSHIASASGALIEWYQYNLYGKPQVYNVAGVYQPGATPQAQDLGNGGSRWMPELGLYDDRNRFMSPDLGRFLQPDPIGFKGDASNLYRYCGNDWANRTDPMGLDTLLIWGHWKSVLNPYGHIAIATTGEGLHSHGNNPADTHGNYSHASVTDYLRQQIPLRSTTIVVLKTSDEQERAINRYMDSLVGKTPNKVTDNCSVRVSDALKAAYPDKGYTTHTPPDVILEAKNVLGGKASGIKQGDVDKAKDYKSFDPKPGARSAEPIRTAPRAVLAANHLGFIQINGAVGGGTSWGEQTSGGFVDAPGSNIDLQTDVEGSFGFMTFVPPQK
jgi:RHS repeat-associated protein